MDVKVRIDGDVTTFAMSGDIDEDMKTGLAALLVQVRTPRLVLDCGAIRKINSMGVRDWIQVFKRYAPKAEILLANCPVAFMDMAIMVPPFMVSGRLESFQAAFVCDECSHESVVRVKVQGGGHDMPHAIVCPKCGSQMHADDELRADLEALLETA